MQLGEWTLLQDHMADVPCVLTGLRAVASLLGIFYRQINVHALSVEVLQSLPNLAECAEGIVKM